MKLRILQRCQKIFNTLRNKEGFGFGFLEVDIDTNRCTYTCTHANNGMKTKLAESHEPNKKQ